MSNDIGFYTKMDGLPPAEKLRDSKGRVVQQEFPHKKKEGKRKRESTTEIDPGKEEEAADSFEENRSGKIVDVVI